MASLGRVRAYRASDADRARRRSDHLVIRPPAGDCKTLGRSCTAAMRRSARRQGNCVGSLPATRCDSRGTRSRRRAGRSRRASSCGSASLRRQLDDREVGRLARLQAAGHSSAQPSASAPRERRHPQQRVARHVRVPAVDEACLGEQVEVGVGREAVGAERDADAAGEELAERVRRVAEGGVRARAVDDGAARQERSIRMSGSCNERKWVSCSAAGYVSGCSQCRARGREDPRHPALQETAERTRNAFAIAPVLRAFRPDGCESGHLVLA